LVDDDRKSGGARTEDLVEDLDLEAALGEAGILAGDGGEELERVLDAASDVGETGDGVQKFDFNRPHTISRQFDQNLRSVAESFAKISTIAVTNLLRMTTVFESRGVRLCGVRDYLDELPQPTCAATVAFAPLKGLSLIHMDIGLSFVFLKRVMGGAAEPERALREFTEIERGIFTRLIMRIAGQLREACGRLVALEPDFVGLENNPSYVSGLPTGESLVILPFLVKMDAVEGPLEIAIPIPSFEPVRQIFDPEESLELRSEHEVQRDRATILEMVQGTHADLVARLGEVEMNLETFLELKQGDVIDLPQAVSAPLAVEIEGRSLFLGEAGRSGQNRAVKLVQRLSEE
jgi:flagellar motor switch protein FliM